jgi:hypothetical protein
VNFILAGVQYYTDSSTDLNLTGPHCDLEILPISPAPALGFSFPMSALLRIPNSIRASTQVRNVARKVNVLVEAKSN